MNDDRTEQALRRALDDAARQVDVPMARLPEPSPAPEGRSSRRPTAVVASLVVIVALAAGSLVFLAARDDGTSSIQVGTAFDGAPITAADADVLVLLDGEVSDEQVSDVRDLLEQSPTVAAYTFVSSDDALREWRASMICGHYTTSTDHSPELRVRLATPLTGTPFATELVSAPGVRQVILNPDRPSPEATTVAPATPEASSTTAASTTLPATTTLPASTSVPPLTSVPAPTTSVVEAPTSTTTTTVTDAPTSTAPPASTVATPIATGSKEIPFVLPAPAPCPTGQSTSGVPARPPATPAATLPPAGEQPADPASAERAIREMWTYTHDGSITLEERFRAHLEDADVLLPLMESIGRDGAVQTTQILGVQFLSPTRAAVLSRNVFQGGSLDVAQVQYVVLIDGEWKWTRQSQCAAIARAGVHCPEGP